MWVANAVSPILVETPEAAHASDVINMDAQTAGSKSANLFAGFTSPAITISGSTPKWAKADDDSLPFRANYACLDSEITVRMGVGTFGLRYDPVSQTGLAAVVSSDGTAAVGFMPGPLNVANRNSFSPYIIHSSAQQGINLAAFGWTTFNQADTFTLGATGFDVYLKWNGIEVFRYKEYLAITPGYAFAYPHGAYNGVGNITVSYLPTALIASNRARKLYDIRDFGAKPITASSTGDMDADSYLLRNVSNPSAYSVGDAIIVEIGGEAGLGRRGTEGVGGVWPSTSYTNEAAMNADTTKAVDSFAWSRSTGEAYRWTGSAWGRARNPYYWDRALPMALRANITAIAGNVLTLDRPATVATSGANIFVDCVPAFKAMTADAALDYGSTIQVPGIYAVGTSIGAPPGKHGLTVMGGGTLVSPKGCICVELHSEQNDYVTFRDLNGTGNHRLGTSGEPDGFLMAGMSTPNSLDNGTAIGFYIATSKSPVMSNIRLTNFISQAIAFDRCINAWGRNCSVTQDIGQRAYLGWLVNQSNAQGGGYVDSSVIGVTKLVKAFEGFSCYPDPATGLGTQFIRCGGQNCMISTNSSIGLRILEWDSTTTPDCFAVASYNAGLLTEPIIYASANAFHTAVDTYIRNPRIRVLGYPDTSDNSTFRQIILVSEDCVGVIIEGEYAGTTTPFSNALGGYIEGPVWDAGSRYSFANAIADQGANTIIRGVRAVGATSPSDAMISTSGGPGYGGGTGVGTVQDCIADTFGFRASTVKSGNRTNAGAAVP